MRILQVVPWFSTGKAASGYVQVVYNISRELVKRGHEVEVYTSNFLGGKRKVKNGYIIIGQIKVNFFNYIVRHCGFFLTPSMISAARINLKTFDVVHIHDFRNFQSIVAQYYARKYCVSYVLQAHGSLSRIGSWQMVKWIYDAFFGYRLLKGASKVIALSNVEVEQYKAMGVPEENIAIIPNGIDLSEYAELPPKGAFKKKFNIPGDRKIILYLGRIHKTKGIDFLVKAYAYLKNEIDFKDALLVIAGPNDGYLNEIKSLVHNLGISNTVMFTGLLSEDDKVKAYVDSDVVVNVEPLNVYGLVPLEAAACSTPVIVSKTNAISEGVLKGKFGFSVKYGDIVSLASMMHRVLIDEELAENLGKNGRKYVLNNLGWNRIVEKYEKVYKEISKR
jgi:glycosyltransferase involved in cell wall biosynthesis